MRVNPYSVDDVAAQIRLALAMPHAEVRARMTRLRQRVRDHDVGWWLRNFLGEFNPVSFEVPAALAGSNLAVATPPAPPLPAMPWTR